MRLRHVGNKLQFFLLSKLEEVTLQQGCFSLRRLREHWDSAPLAFQKKCKSVTFSHWGTTFHNNDRINGTADWNKFTYWMIGIKNLNNSI